MDILLWVSVPQSPSVLPRVTSPIRLGQGRQTSLREQVCVWRRWWWRGAGALRLPAAENLLSLRWASKARPGALSRCEMWPITLSQQGGSVKWMLGPALHQADTLVFVRGKGAGSWVSGEEPEMGTNWPWFSPPAAWSECLETSGAA